MAETPAELRVAVRARQAQVAWSSVSVAERLRVVGRFRARVADQALGLARLSAAARARPEAEVLTAEVLPLLDACRFLERSAASLLAPQRPGRRYRPFWLGGTHLVIHREPLGLVLIIGPGNYPLFLPGVQAIQALVAGNAVLWKPGTGGLPVATACAAWLADAGLPSDLCAVLGESPASAGAALAAGVDKVVLTGSAATGRLVLARAAETLTPATVELSGMDVAIIRADADLSLAARAVAFGLRLNAGATCIAPRRILVHEPVAEAFCQALQRALADAPAVTVPLASLGAWATSSAASAAWSRQPVAGELDASRAGLRAPFVAVVDPDSPWLREAWFAPVALLAQVRDDAHALLVANASAYALGASLFGRERRALEHLAGRLRAGVVTVNDLVVPTADPRLPFGGRGQSGFGTTRGAEGLLEMTVPKAVSVRSGRWRPHYDPVQPGDAAFFEAFVRAVHGAGWGPRFRALRRLVSLAWRRRR